MGTFLKFQITCQKQLVSQKVLLRIFIEHYEEDWMQACHCTLEIGMLLSKTFKVEKVFDRKKPQKNF
jgi:hypothetical protein